MLAHALAGFRGLCEYGRRELRKEGGGWRWLLKAITGLAVWRKPHGEPNLPVGQRRLLSGSDPARMAADSHSVLYVSGAYSAVVFSFAFTTSAGRFWLPLFQHGR
jgi:hypothetical protein